MFHSHSIRDTAYQTGSPSKQGRPETEATPGYMSSRGPAVNKDSLPDLQVQQPPDAIAVAAAASTVGGESSPDRVFFELAAHQRAPLYQHTLQVIPVAAPPTSKPTASGTPSSAGPQSGKNICDGCLQLDFPDKPLIEYFGGIRALNSTST
jgi:hypothetical protein